MFLRSKILLSYIYVQELFVCVLVFIKVFERIVWLFLMNNRVTSWWLNSVHILARDLMIKVINMWGCGICESFNPSVACQQVFQSFFFKSILLEFLIGRQKSYFVAPPYCIAALSLPRPAVPRSLSLLLVSALYILILTLPTWVLIGRRSMLSCHMPGLR